MVKTTVNLLNKLSQYLTPNAQQPSLASVAKRIDKDTVVQITLPYKK